MVNVNDERKELRADLTTKVEFSLDPEVIRAFTVDVSRSGVRLETETPIKIRLRFAEDVVPEDHIAQLVWAQESESGHMEYGFKYIPKEEL